MSLARRGDPRSVSPINEPAFRPCASYCLTLSYIAPCKSSDSVPTPHPLVCALTFFDIALVKAYVDSLDAQGGPSFPMNFFVLLLWPLSRLF